jgi:ribosome biogenesis protein ENP2
MIVCVVFACLQALGDDFDKLVFLRADRSIEFHARYGRYFVTRIPKFGRDMAYHFPSCDLLAVGSSREIYRLNLEQVPLPLFPILPGSPLN